ncbi:MAG: hypothetical protein IJ644_10890 [Oscillospiraceae bacterium]|nr:hypothetical protein [Oscillospiraceae bacterium]
MKILQKGTSFYLEGTGSPFIEAEGYCAADILYDEDILIVADENGSVYAWDIKTGEEITELRENILLPCAESGWGMLISKDMKAVRKVPAKIGKKVWFSWDISGIGGNLAVVPAREGFFGRDVYHLSKNGTSWEEMISGFESILERNTNHLGETAYLGMTVKKGRLCQVLATLSGKVMELPASAEFRDFDVSTEQAVFQEGSYYAVYDAASGKELFRTAEFPRHEFLETGTLWYNAELYYYGGQLHKIQEYVRNRTGAAYQYGGCLKVRNQENMYFLINVQTGRKSDCYSGIEIPCEIRNHFFVEKNGKKGLLNRNLEVIFPPEYDHIQYVHKNQTYILRKGEKFGRAGRNGNIVSPVIWDRMSANDTGNYDSIVVYTGEKMAFMTPDGRLVCEPFYGEAIIGINKTVMCFRKYPDKEKQEKSSVCCINIYTKETVLEGDFDEIQGLPSGYISVHKDGLSAVFDVVKKKFVSEMALCHISEEDDTIRIHFLETGKIRIINIKEELI